MRFVTFCIGTYMIIYHTRSFTIFCEPCRTISRQVCAWRSYFLARGDVKHYNKDVIKNSFPRFSGFSVILNVLIYYDDMTSSCIQVSILSLFPCR